MVKMNKRYKSRLKPNKEQSIYFEKAFGCSRKMYNIYMNILSTILTKTITLQH